jgi:hypothetical protein
MTKLPAIVIDQQHAISRASLWVATVRDRLGKDWSREWLESTLRRCLRGIDVSDGERLTIAIKAVEAADQGDEIADAALREVGTELIERPTGRPGDVQIVAYLQRAARRAPHKRKQGRHWADDWYRNILICVLIQLACVEFGVAPTRNRASRRAGAQPCGVSIVTAALARNRIHLDEGTVQQRVWLGLPGDLTRQAFAKHIKHMLVSQQIP